MPVSQRAITNAIKNAQTKPGKTSQEKRDEIGKPCLFPYPAQQIKKCENCMKNKKEEIEKMIQKHPQRLMNRPCNLEP